MHIIIYIVYIIYACKLRVNDIICSWGWSEHTLLLRSIRGLKKDVRVRNRLRFGIPEGMSYGITEVRNSGVRNYRGTEPRVWNSGLWNSGVRNSGRNKIPAEGHGCTEPEFGITGVRNRGYGIPGYGIRGCKIMDGTEFRKARNPERQGCTELWLPTLRALKSDLMGSVVNGRDLAHLTPEIRILGNFSH